MNIDATALLAELAADAAFIYFSTDLVFDGHKGNYVETDAANPVSYYVLEEELTAKGFQIQHARDAQKATSHPEARHPPRPHPPGHQPAQGGRRPVLPLREEERDVPLHQGPVLLQQNKARMEQLVAECGADGYLSKSDPLGKWIVENA